jgi:hypothetical protein
VAVGYRCGIVRAVVALVALFAGTLAWRRMLPAENSAYFLKFIVGSMSSRYADFVRDGDTVRAAAMKDLLQRLEAYFDAGATENDWTGWKGSAYEAVEQTARKDAQRI